VIGAIADDRDAYFSTALLRIAAASALLAPAAIGTRLASAATRSRIEADCARSELVALGVFEQPLAIEALGGGRSNAVYKLRFATRTLVLKVALSEGTLLAFAARLVGPQPYARDVSAAARIAREARALDLLHAAGVRVPRVIAASPEAGLLLVEYVAGEPLPETLDRPGAANRIRAYAAALRAVHAAGIALADAHPGNALVGADGSITLIDLEFAEPVAADQLAARAAFDIAYAAQYFTGAERRTFLSCTGLDVAAELTRLADLGLLFAIERRRQRKTTALVTFDAIPRAA
jgi:hypothetical protein